MKDLRDLRTAVRFDQCKLWRGLDGLINIPEKKLSEAGEQALRHDRAG